MKLQNETLHRVLLWQFYLNDVVDGGETEFLYQNRKVEARKGRLGDRSGLVGTAQEFADLVEEFGEDADNDGFLLSGDLHPVTLHRFLDDLVPVLRRRGILRSGYGGGGLRGNLFEF